MTNTETNTDAGNVTVLRLENFINRYASFTDDYSLPIALWTICTYIFPNFDAFPYMVITSDTKRSGKTRLAELVSFICSNPRNFGAMTASSMFRIIEEVQPTIFFDEAEMLTGESAGMMRSVLNMGYRRGSTVPRTIGNQVIEFRVYCPKVFILIGDVLDTLRDRSIIIRMKRAEAKERFVYDSAKAEGENLRDEIQQLIDEKSSEIANSFVEFSGMDFLTDRDEEIWTPIFVLASVICPSRIEELKRIAVDMATEKTAPKKNYRNLMQSEEEAMNEEYGMRLLGDLHNIMSAMGQKPISNVEAVEKLREIQVAPWRKFRGDGITKHNIADMLARFGVKCVPIRKGSEVFRGYKWEAVEKAHKSAHR